MNAEHYGHHISQRFNQELDEVRRKVLAAGGLVEQQLEDALAALLDGDAERGATVVANDRRVNELEREVDEECTLVLARRQPVASDLRLVIAIFKAISDLERMGDEAKRVARMALERGEGSAVEPGREALRQLGALVRRMLREALDAFARTDPGAALRVIGEDGGVDREYERVVHALIDSMMQNPASVPKALGVLWSARALERIGDRACNICEYVIYCVKGHDVRHVGLDQIQREALRGHWDEAEAESETPPPAEGGAR